MKEEKEQKIITKYSAGGYFSIDFMFEQIKNNKYATWSGTQQDSTIVTQNEISLGPFQYFPLEKVAWQLAKEPLEYENKEKLWEEVRTFIFEHLFLPDEALYDVLTAWVFASWIPEIWTVVPYIFFFGAVASGKTRGLEILSRLSYRGILSSNISSAALFRACEEWSPTVILDETEIYSKTDKADIIGLLNSGYRKGQYAVRAKNTEQGITLEVFDVFGFKAMAGTEGLAQALESRSIIIRMIKNRRKVRLFVDEHKAEELRGKLLRWRFDTLHFTWKNKEEWKEMVNKEEGGELGELGEHFLQGIPPLKVESGRVQELFQCLLAVANSGREIIAKYAEKMDRMRSFEEKAGVEAELVEILLRNNLVTKESVVLTKELSDAFNQSRNDREKWKSSSIGRIMRRLGFERTHTMKGNGWLVDVERLRYLKEIYMGEYKPQTEHEPYEPYEPFPDGVPHKKIDGYGQLTIDKVGGATSEKGSYHSYHSSLSEDIIQDASLSVYCHVCHELTNTMDLSRKLGKPTCKRCAGELND